MSYDLPVDQVSAIQSEIASGYRSRVTREAVFSGRGHYYRIQGPPYDERAIDRERMYRTTSGVWEHEICTEFDHLRMVVSQQAKDGMDKAGIDTSHFSVAMPMELTYTTGAPQ